MADKVPGYQDTPPFDASTLVLFRKRITADMLNEARETLECLIYRMCKSYGLSLPRRYRRRARKEYLEFGAKLDVSIDEEGYGRLEKVSFDAYNESGCLIEAAERYKTRRILYALIWLCRKYVVLDGQCRVKIA